MFKLIKILNAGTNTPEPVILPKAEGAIAQGEVLVLSGGKLTKAGATTRPTHIALAAAAEGEGETVAAEIISDMIFECPVMAGTPQSLAVGTKVCLEIADGITVGVNTTTTSGVATVYNAMSATAIGDKILVKFN